MATEVFLAEALGLYNLTRAETELIRHNENMTYKVTDDGKKYVLRIHKPIEGFSLGIFEVGDRTASINSELEIIDALKCGTNLRMQVPVCGKNGDFAHVLTDGTPVSLLEWVDGQSVDSVERTPEILRGIGKLSASMHIFFSERSAQKKTYCRYNYDQTILPLIAARMRAASQLGAVTAEQSQTVLDALDEMCKRFDKLDSVHEKIIVHADLSKSNMILTADGGITPIDFSLSGYSHFYMDIGGLYGHITGDEERKLVIEGYKSVCGCEINPHYIEPYFALQVILFIACQYERAKDWDWFGGAMERWCRDIFKPLIEETAFLSVDMH